MILLHILLLCRMYVTCLCGEISIFEHKSNYRAIICITEIVGKYFPQEITFVEINSEDSRLLKALHSVNVSVITRNSTAKLEAYNEGYVIQAGNITGFANGFKNLTRERPWNPTAKFLVFIESMDKNNITAVFDELLKVHVTNVLVINGSDDADIYTYNPFENYRCGRRYDEVISFGSCERPVAHNLYPEKLVTGLENCSFRAIFYSPPPFKLTQKVKSPSSTEIFVLETLASLEQFNLDLIFLTTNEVADVDADFRGTGYLGLLQKNELDIAMGFRILTQSRAAAFDYFHWHLAFADAYVYVVAKARNIPSWKSIFIEFSALVWVLMAIVFILYSMLAKFIISDRDTGYIVVKMWSIFLGHGEAQSEKKFRYVLLQWLWFSYLIGCFYQSSLCSFTVNPKKEHQVLSEEELSSYNLKPCINKVTKHLVNLTLYTAYEEIDGCNSMEADLERVSDFKGLFTVTVLSLFKTQLKIKENLFVFDKEIYKISYAIYLYKGFPMFDKLVVHTLQLRENGLIEKYLNDVYLYFEVEQQINKSRETDYNKYEPLFVVPWSVYVFGVILASAAFGLEIYSKHGKKKFDKGLPMKLSYL